MTDNYVSFFVPFSDSESLYSSFSSVDRHCQLIDMYRDHVHADMIVTFVFLRSLSVDQCKEIFSRYVDSFPKLGMHHVRESYSDSES